MKIIGHIKTDFKTKFGIPRQSGLIEEIVGKIVFESEYRNPKALRGLEEYTHLWILWQFSENNKDSWSPTVRPPILGGNKRVGVFATRSPYRPNPIGLSAVKILKISLYTSEGPVIYVSGPDLMNMTPIYDIKPYLPYADSIENASGGFTDYTEKKTLAVHIPEEYSNLMPKKKQDALIKVLASDPRPSYHKDKDRVYGFNYAGYEVTFQVDENILIVLSISKDKSEKNVIKKMSLE